MSKTNTKVTENLRDRIEAAIKAAMDKGEPCNLLKMLADDPDFPLSEAEMTDVLNPSAYIGRCPEQVQALVNKTRPLFEGADRENAEINI